MDFSLADEQELLASSARSLAADMFGESVARQALGGDYSKADEGWSQLQAAGLTTLLIAEDHGGGEGTLLDACLVTTELYSALAPVPYLTSAVVAPLLLRGAPADRAAPKLAALAEGATYGLVVDKALSWPPAGPEVVCLDWRPGREGLLLDAERAELIPFESRTGIDPLHPVGVATVEGRAARAEADLLAQGQRALAAVRVAVAAALTGCLAGAAQLAWDYIATRQQYGKPIASFQAVRHMAADLLVDLETCRSVSLGAAWQVDNEPIEDAVRVAMVAKTWCGQAAVRAIETAIQLLGGIGVTWESTAHLYLRTAHQLASAFGDTRTLLRQVGGQFVAARGGRGDGSA
jgi:alkylation response protein AidB-like acyl-CoA dehydrogenase